MGYYSLIKKSTITLVALFSMALSVSAQSGNGRWDRNQDDRYDNNRYNDRYDDYKSGWTRERTRTFAEMFGYRLAFGEFQEAINNGYSPREFRNQSSYRNDTTGWFNWMGSREDYRNGFRKGYENGFRDVTSYRQNRYSRQEIERVLGARMKDVYPREKYYDDDYYGGGNGGYDNGGYNNGGYNNGGYNGGYGNGGYNSGSRYSREEIVRIASQNAYQDGFRHGQEDARRNRQYNFQDSDGFRRATNGYRSEFGNLEFYKQAFRESYTRAYAEGFRSIRRY
jgi:hypothetical protein